MPSKKKPDIKSLPLNDNPIWKELILKDQLKSAKVMAAYGATLKAIAIKTGLTIKEVKRILASPEEDHIVEGEEKLAARKKAIEGIRQIRVALGKKKLKRKLREYAAIDVETTVVPKVISVETEQKKRKRVSKPKQPKFPKEFQDEKDVGLTRASEIAAQLAREINVLKDEVARMKEHVGWINILGITTSLGFIFFFIVVAAGFI